MVDEKFFVTILRSGAVVYVIMGLSGYRKNYSDEALEKFSEGLLDRHGLEACEAAEILEGARLNSGTLTTYKPQVRQVVSELGENPEPEDVVDLIEDTDKAASTKNVMVVAMKNYYQQIDEEGKSDEIDDIAHERGVAEINFNKNKEIKEWLTEDEVNTIIDTLLPEDGEISREVAMNEKAWYFDIEYKALFCALYYTGCRVQEVLLIEKDDMYPDTNEMELYRLKKKGKGVKRDMKAVPGELIDVLQEYMDYANIDSGKIFRFTPKTAQNRMSDISDAYQFFYGEFDHAEKLTPHKLRHARVTAIANNASLEEAGQYVEHSSPEVTNSYRHISTEEQRDILPENSEDEVGDDMVETIMEKFDLDSKEEVLEKLEELDGV